MKNSKKIIESKVKDSSFYMPVLTLLKNSKKPLSIKQISKKLNITYAAAKPRLHKLEKWNLIERLKRGYYCLPEVKDNFSNLSKIKGDLFFINGCIRIMGQGNGVWITIYNSKFGEKNNKNYCIIENFNEDRCILRKSNEFNGNKLYLLKSKSVGISVSRKEISENILSKLSTKATPLKIGVYLDEWNISIEDLFGTESPEDGQLASELNKIGEIKKPSKFDDLKSDIIFNYKNKKIPIEVTTIKPSMNAKLKQHRKNSIKSSQILMRFYYSIKWNLLHELPTILVLHSDWLKYGWIEKEEKFMQKFKCFIIFTNFEDNWAHKSALEIRRLIESSRFNKTTPLTST